MIKLRDYQADLYGGIKTAWERVKAVLAVLPTGGGKTVIFSSAIRDHDGAAAAVAHRKEIVSQISGSLAKLGIKHRVIAQPNTIALIRRKHLREYGKSFIDPSAPVGVVSVQTLTSKSARTNIPLRRWLKSVGLGVFDEGHHYVEKGLWGRAVEMLPQAKLLFVTATPDRADGKGLGAHADGFCDEMVEGPSTQWLLDQGYLSDFAYFCPRSDLNQDNIPLTASGDVNTKEMRKRITESHLVGDVVQHYLRLARGKKTIVFANDVATAEELAQRFRDTGVRAEAVSGATEQGQRDRHLSEFEHGDLMVLVNVDLFDEGFDVPAAECAILARVTESLAKYLQMVGRVLRPVYAPGMPLDTAEQRKAAMAAGPKPRAAIIDPVRNWERHGAPNWARKWTLDRTGGEGSGKARLRACTLCTQPYELFHKECPYCGEPVPLPGPGGRSTPEKVDGDLLEMDAEAFAALCQQINAADMSDDEYALNQCGRNLPPIARGADMRRHQEAKYRRKVLRELVAWWVGCQPERGLSEVHRRFFHRFGIDIGTAFTLKARETDALIELIQDKFTEDLAG